jgi:hypothetical protein
LDTNVVHVGRGGPLGKRRHIEPNDPPIGLRKSTDVEYILTRRREVELAVIQYVARTSMTETAITLVDIRRDTTANHGQRRSNKRKEFTPEPSG